jgi:hypothetical protein
MKKYYIGTTDWNNAYSLGWSERIIKSDKWTRITKAKAITYAREERRRRKNDENFSGYADTHIYPIDKDQDTVRDINYWSKHLDKTGYIVE